MSGQLPPGRAERDVLADDFGDGVQIFDSLYPLV